MIAGDAGRHGRRHTTGGARELLVLGTASQVPTRTRNHNGYLLRWGRELILFDPGEGTQRQMTIFGAKVSQITRICITHAHGDHCYGLPGVLERMWVDQATRPVDIHYPRGATDVIHHLLAAAHFDDRPDRRLDPASPGIVTERPGFVLSAGVLDHDIPTLGWRVDEPAGWHLDPDLLEAAGVPDGPERSVLQLEGAVSLGDRTILIDEVAHWRQGQSMAFVMDTRWCDGALELAAGVDLLVCEATFLETERDHAEQYGHLTAAQAGRIAAEAGARRLLLTHFSRRYPDTQGHLAEASAFHDDVVAADDGMVVAVPHRAA